MVYHKGNANNTGSTELRSPSPEEQFSICQNIIPSFLREASTGSRYCVLSTLRCAFSYFNISKVTSMQLAGCFS